MKTQSKRYNEKLLKNDLGQYRYQFNWIGGGFNDVWAKNIKEFKLELKRQFGNSNLEVNYDSLHKATMSSIHPFKFTNEWDKRGEMESW
jgi:hypothetical protein